MTVAYGVIFAISLFFPVGYFFTVAKKQKEPWLLTLFICVSISSLGWLLLSASRTVGFALFANKIAYLGQIYLILSMLMIISKLCGFTQKRATVYVFGAISTLMLGLVWTTGYLGWYYKSVTLVRENGASRLVKEYGPLHILYLIYVFLMFAMMILVIIHSLRQNKKASQKIAGLMVAVVVGNIGMWLMEKLVTFDFEFLAISYIMAEGVFLFTYIILHDYVKKTDLPEGAPPVAPGDEMTVEQKIDTILSGLPDKAALSSRQRDILKGILEGKSRKRIAAELFLSENTVKMHTSSLYRLLDVSSRDEIFSLLEPKS